MFSDVLTGNFLIGLREGLEAALVVTILVASTSTRPGERIDCLPCGPG